MAVRERSVPRLAGVDLARAIAMLGMLIVHTKLNDAFGTAESPEDERFLWVNVWTAPLFLMVAGVGLSLLWRHRRTTRTRAMVIVRAIALLLIGLWLETQFYGAILQYFALYFVLGALALPLGRRGLATMAAGCLVLGPLLITYLVHAGSISLGERHDVGFEALTEPVLLLRALAVDGVYPAVVWSGFFFAGMLIGRLDLDDPRLAARLATVGAFIGAAGTFASWIGARTFGSDPFGWTHHWTGSAHSESLAWAVTSAGIAVGVTGASLWIALRLGGRVRLLAPVIALGQMALTFYLLHLWYTDTLWRDIEADVSSSLAYLAATLAFYLLFAGGAWIWLRVFRRGPVEGVIDLVARTIVRPRPLPSRPLAPDRV